MDFKVRMISKEKIKPCSATPDHLRIHKLCLLDQIAPNTYVPLLFFYSAPAQSYKNISDHLKNSLAETLTHFRHFAGRAKDLSYISCNDEGATYIEAFVDVDISIVLKHPKVEQLQQLLPCSPYEDLSKPGIEDLLAVQVNYFARGGVAVAVSVHHVAGDASSVHTFVESWSAIARGANVINRLTFDFTSLFPPIESLDLSFATYETESSPKTVVRKRFVFESSKIAVLREAIGRRGPHLDRPTRYEAVAALLWGAFIDVTRDTDETVKEHVAIGVVDLRKKMNLPSGERCVGNLWKWTAAHCSAGNIGGYSELAVKIRESSRQMDREWKEIDGYLALSRNALGRFGKNSSARVFYLSWCNFPFYEVDFGWGRPDWIGTGKTPDMGAYFSETSDGKGLEAWVGLPMEDMARFEKNPDILKYSSSFKSLSRI